MASQDLNANPPTSQLGVSTKDSHNLQVMSPNIQGPETSTQQSVLNRLREITGISANTPIPDDASNDSGDKSVYMDVSDKASLLAVREPSVPLLPQEQDARSTPVRDDQSKRSVRPRTVEAQSLPSGSAPGLQPSRLVYGTDSRPSSSSMDGNVSGHNPQVSPEKAVLRSELQSKDNAISLLMQRLQDVQMLATTEVRAQQNMHKTRLAVCERECHEMARTEAEEAAAGVTADYSGEIQRLRQQESQAIRDHQYQESLSYQQLMAQMQNNASYSAAYHEEKYLKDMLQSESAAREALLKSEMQAILADSAMREQHWKEQAEQSSAQTSKARDDLVSETLPSSFINVQASNSNSLPTGTSVFNQDDQDTFHDASSPGRPSFVENTATQSLSSDSAKIAALQDELVFQQERSDAKLKCVEDENAELKNDSAEMKKQIATLQQMFQKLMIDQSSASVGASDHDKKGCGTISIRF